MEINIRIKCVVCTGLLLTHDGSLINHGYALGQQKWRNWYDGVCMNPIVNAYYYNRSS